MSQDEKAPKPKKNQPMTEFNTHIKPSDVKETTIKIIQYIKKLEDLWVDTALDRKKTFERLRAQYKTRLNGINKDIAKAMLAAKTLTNKKTYLAIKKEYYDMLKAENEALAKIPIPKGNHQFKRVEPPAELAPEFEEKSEENQNI